MDEVTTFHRNAQGIVYSNHWTRNLLESGWRLNGNTFSNGGIGGPGLSPGAPAGNTDGITTPVEMTSEGTLKVVVQYSGDPQQMPTEVGVVVDSTAFAAFLPSGNSQADNGLGDESEYSSFMVEEGAGGLDGERSSGRNLRIIPLNSSGYGELEFSPSASATSSANTPLVWAEAQSATATLDPRRISIWIPGQSTFYRRSASGNPTTFTKIFFYGEDPADHPNYTFSYLTFNPEPIVPQSSSQYSQFISFKAGLSRSESLAPNADTSSSTEFIGRTTFPQSMWNGNTHGTANFVNYYYSIGNNEDFWVTRSKTHHRPLNLLRVVTGFSPELEVYNHQLRSVGETESTSFTVSYSDGVKGKASIEREFVDSAQPHQYGPQKTYLPESAPLKPIIPVDNQYVVNGFIQAGQLTHSFYVDPSVEFLIEGQNILTLGFDTAGVILNNHPLGAAAHATVRSLLETPFNDFIDRSVQQISVLDIDPENRIGPYGYEGLFKSNPNGFRWKLYTKLKLHVQYVTVSAYGQHGFEGTLLHESQQLDPDMAGQLYAIGVYP